MSAPTAAAAAATERDILLHGWEQMESAAIVKDVATKGRFINLAHAFLARRRKCTVDQARQYFRTEIDAYIQQLLSNGQVFRAEHVLKNLGRPVKYMLYEFLATADESSTPSASSSTTGESGGSPTGSKSSDIIAKYLDKAEPNLAAERVELDFGLQMLAIVRNNEQLHNIYAPKLPVIALEELYKQDESFRQVLACDVLFVAQQTLEITGLDKRTAWTYLLDGKRFELIVQWIDALSEKPCGSGSSAYSQALSGIFRQWPLEEDMLEALRLAGAGNVVRDCLARNGLFLSDEENNFQKILRRICSTGSWSANADRLNTEAAKRDIVQLILDNGFTPFLALDIVDADALLAQRDAYPKLRHIIDFCLALRHDVAARPDAVSATVSAHILKSNPTFHKQQPLIYLTELMLRNPNLNDVLASASPTEPLHADPTILAQIPLLRVLLAKHQAATHVNDYNCTLNDLVKRFAKIDLRHIQNEAGGLPLAFDNPTLTAKYGATERLGYMFYVKQARSAFAVFVFAIEQLQLYAQISRSQIMYACSQVTAVAMERPADGERVAHCVAFMEMLGVNTMGLRAYLRCVRVMRNREQAANGRQEEGREFSALSEAERLQALVDAQSMGANGSYNVRDLDALKVVCAAHALPLPSVFLAQKAAVSNWMHWLAFATYYDYSLESVLEVLAAEGELAQMDANVRRNLRTALMYDRKKRTRHSGQLSMREQRRKVQMGRQQDGAMRTSGDTMSSSLSSAEIISNAKLVPSHFLEQHEDLFAMILRCTVSRPLPYSSAAVRHPLTITYLLVMFDTCIDHLSHDSTLCNLLHTAIHMKWPIFAVLAATTVPSDSDEQTFCWYVWLSLSTSAPIPTDVKTIGPLATALVKHTLQDAGWLQTLHQSMLIFYPNNAFTHFTEYLHRTADLEFGTDVTQLLNDFLVALNDDDGPTAPLYTENQLDFAVSLLMQHLQYGFRSGEHRQLLLDSVCASAIPDHTHLVNFDTVQRLHTICAFTSATVDVGQLILGGGPTEATSLQAEYERLRDCLVAEREFAKALELADLVRLPRDSIIYESWVAEYETLGDDFDLARCEREIGEYSLAPELVITFYTHVAHGLPYENERKYAVLKRIMDVIKRHRLFPNESFNCDRIEYDMVMSYLRGPCTIQTLDVYYSDYFETIMRRERGVLYKSFAELKEISGIEDLTVDNKRKLSPVECEKLDALIYRLLDDGDIVQALRLQAIFLHRPLDLHYLVFCMALAEGLASLSDLSPEQAQMNRDARKFAMSRFNRRRPMRANSQSSTNAVSSGSPRAPANADAIATNPSNVDTNDFEEIPSRAKQDILAALQNFAARCKHGTSIAQRIMHTWRAAVYLDKEYADVLHTKDAYVLLESAIADDCMYKLSIMQDIMDAMALTKLERAEFLADKFATSIIRAQFYILAAPSNLPAVVGPIGGPHTLWGYDLEREFRQFLDLGASAAALGNSLLHHCDALRVYRRYDAVKCPTPEADEPPAVRLIYRRLRSTTLEQRVLSHKKQNTIGVELLVKAHECFVHECYMEGIAGVLHRTRTMCTVLTAAKSWSLIVRMLMGIGRYREMYFCFETLIRNDQFESLLRQFDGDRVRVGFNQACISYLRECCPENGEYYRLAALHFRMYKEIAQMWEQEARGRVAALLEKGGQIRGEAIVVSGENGTVAVADGGGEPGADCVPLYLRCSTEVAAQLTQAMEGYANAAENYLIDNKLALAQQTAIMAELVALQIYLVQKALREAAAALASVQSPNSGAGGSNNSPSSVVKCICVVNIPSATVLKHFVNNNLSVPQSLILGRAYPYELNWTDALYTHYVLHGNDRYLQDYCERMQLTEPMIEALVKQFQRQQDVTPRMELAIGRLVDLVETVTTRYRLASLLGLKRCVANMINDHSLYYLKDTNYGRNEGGNVTK